MVHATIRGIHAMTTRAIAIIALLLAPAPLWSQSAPARTIALRAARVLDPGSGRMSAGVVVVRGDRIDSISASPPSGADVVDLGNLTLMPGLIDAHTHVLLQPEDEVTPQVLTQPQEDRTIEGARAVKIE